MKILAIGDLHGKVPKGLPKKDINLILVTGDLGSSNIWRKWYFKNVERGRKGLGPIEDSKIIKRGFLEWHDSAKKVLSRLSKIAPVFLIYGNIDKTNRHTKKISKEVDSKLPFLENFMKKKKIRIINNRKANFDGLKIGGIPFFTETDWLKRFDPKNKERRKKAKKITLKEKKTLRWFGKKINVLLSHQPPYGILDKVTAKYAPKNWRGKHGGSKIILNYIKKYQPDYVICGHIHEGAGEKKIGKTKVINLGELKYKIIEI